PHPLYAFFFSHAPAPTAISPLSLHDALPISTNNSLGAAGVAFHARLMPMKVLNEGGWGTTADVADGIRWAAEHGAQVINLSLGGPRNSGVLHKAITFAVSRGVVVVAAAGNTGGRGPYPRAAPRLVG